MVDFMKLIRKVTHKRYGVVAALCGARSGALRLTDFDASVRCAKCKKLLAAAAKLSKKKVKAAPKRRVKAGPLEALLVETRDRLYKAGQLTPEARSSFDAWITAMRKQEKSQRKKEKYHGGTRASSPKRRNRN